MDQISRVKREVIYANWQAMVEECQSSGLTVIEWCKRNNVNIKTYYYRLRKLRTLFVEEHKEELIPEFAQLPVAAIPEHARTNITIHLDGMSVEIPKGSDENTIAAVLRAVKSAW